MVDINQVMFEMIRRSNSVTTSSVNEIEEIVDTGLEKTEDNIQKIAMEYLDEKGYARSVQNMDMAKKHITESSAYYDTVRVRKTRRMVEDLLQEAQPEELEKLMDVCLLDNLMKVGEKLDMIANRRVDYAVEVVDEIQLDSEKPSALQMPPDHSADKKLPYGWVSSRRAFPQYRSTLRWHSGSEHYSLLGYTRTLNYSNLFFP